MTSEPEYNAHHHCVWCHGLKAKKDIIFVDDKPVCFDGDCKDLYHRNNRPHPIPKGMWVSER